MWCIDQCMQLLILTTLTQEIRTLQFTAKENLHIASNKICIVREFYHL